MTVDWSDRNLHRVKRALSCYEKASLRLPNHRALIMAGEPPLHDKYGEVEELLQVGYRPDQIVIVERDEDRAIELYNHYYDTITVHVESVENFLPFSRSMFGYIHLDFCGFLLPDLIDGIQQWQTKISPLARIRVSMQYTRRTPTQVEYEQSIRRSIIDLLCRELEKLDTERPERWEFYRETFLTSEDSTHIVGFLWLLNFTFGLGIWQYADRCTLQQPYLPRLPATGHIPRNIQRFTYNEVSGNAVMATVWADMVAFDSAGLPSKQQWVIDELAQVIDVLASPIPSFNNPDLFMEANNQ